MMPSPKSPKPARINTLMQLTVALALSLSALTTGPTEAGAQSITKGASGLPLPRFASLKASRLNLRVGPGTNYAVSWLYVRPGLPVEIIQEYDNWRRIRDVDGTEGWVYHSLLSGNRTATAAPWMRSKGDDVFVNMRSDSTAGATIVARLQPGVIINLDECTGEWCHASADSYEGWVSQSEIWGAYPGEAFK